MVKDPELREEIRALLKRVGMKNMLDEMAAWVEEMVDPDLTYPTHYLEILSYNLRYTLDRYEQRYKEEGDDPDS